MGVLNKNLSKNNDNILSFNNDRRPFDKENLGKLIQIPPYKNNEQISFYFDLPGIDYKDMRKGKLEAICHLLKHEGKNSINKFLLAENLALSTSCETDSEKIYKSEII